MAQVEDRKLKKIKRALEDDESTHTPVKKKKTKSHDVDVLTENGSKKHEDLNIKKKKKMRRFEKNAESSNQGDVDAEPIKEKKKKKKKKEEEEEEEEDTQIMEEANAVKMKKRKKHHGSTVYHEDKTDSSGTSPTRKDAANAHVEPTSSSATSNNDIVEFFEFNNITISNGSVHPFLSFSALFTHPKANIPTYLQEKLSKKFKAPTPIQACAWPAAVGGSDVIGVAETGSGKTLSFLIPLISRLLSPHSLSSKSSVDIKGLIISPTRELAIQTHDSLTELCDVSFEVPSSEGSSDVKVNIKSVAVYGGVGKDEQRNLLTTSNPSGGSKKSKNRKNKLKGLDDEIVQDILIVVGTPGRIKDLAQEGSCDLSKVTYLVLDEADRMLDKGFEPDIREIISHTTTNSADSSSDNRQTLMFSATWPPSVRQLAASFLKNPVRITVGSEDLSANKRVTQVLEVFDDEWEKDSRLFAHLSRLLSKTADSEKQPLILIFALYKKECTRVHSLLSGSFPSQGNFNKFKRNNRPNSSNSIQYRVASIHGDLSQPQRLDALQKFKSGECNILVATDVAARGLDIPNVAVVVNYTFPLTVEDYVHRIGRTGRASATGTSLTFFTGAKHEKALAGELAKLMRESGYDEGARMLREKFPNAMTIKKKEHSAYGNWYREPVVNEGGEEGAAEVKATHMVFD